MPWDFNDKEPIYLQIVNKMQNKILSGDYKSGDKIESVRELASIAGVNPNTMQKALTVMESLGIIETQRTLGKFITNDNEIIKSIKKEKLEEKIKIFLDSIKDLGYSTEDVIPLLLEYNENLRNVKASNLEELIREENNERINTRM